MRERWLLVGIRDGMEREIGFGKDEREKSWKEVGLEREKEDELEILK